LPLFGLSQNTKPQHTYNKLPCKTQPARRPSTTAGFSTGKEAATSDTKWLQSTAQGFHPVSIHQMAPPERGNTSDNKLLLIYQPQKDERPSWLTCSGRFTHISGHPSATGRAQHRDSSSAKDRRSTTVLCN